MKYTGKFVGQYQDALKGKLPPIPDFSAPTHAGYQRALAEVVAMAEAGDLAALQKHPMVPASSSREAICRYRNLAILAMMNSAKGTKKSAVAPRNAASTEPTLPEEEGSRDVFAPSQGVVPYFGPRQVTTEDGVHYLYLMKLKGDLAAVMGREPHSLVGKCLIKVGYSNDPDRRCQDLNAAFPPAGRFEWHLAIQSKGFSDGASAKAAEDEAKTEFNRVFESLGGEFFLGPESKIESAFNRIASR
jgi:hypothetical protein